MSPTDLPPPPPTATDRAADTGDGTVPPPPGRPVRRSGDRVVAGVAAGLGRHFGIDPVLVRVLFVVTTFAAGFGALAYVILWIVLPKVEGPAPREATTAERGTGFWVGVAAVTVGGIIALSNLPAPRLFVPLALIAIGAALWQRPGGAAGGPTAAGATGATTVAATSTAAVGARQQTGATGALGVGAAEGSAGSATTPLADDAGAGSWAPVSEVRWWVPPAPRPRPSWLGPIVVAVALVVTGIVAALGVADVLTVRGSDLVAVALLVLAGGLLVGTAWGRAKWLSLPAMALAGVLVVMQLAGSFGVHLVPTIGERRVSATTLDGTLEARHGIGELEVDLADATLGPDAAVDLDIGIGRALVVVPEDVTVEITGQVGIGALNVHVASGTDPQTGEPIVTRRELAEGTRLRLDEVVASAAPDADVLRLDVAAGIAGIDLYRGRDAFEADQFGWNGEDVGGLSDEWSGTDLETRLDRFFVEELCAGGASPDTDMVECWSRVVDDPAVVDELAAEDDFFADFCLDPLLVASEPGLTADCLDLLDVDGADLRPDGSN
ncbi:PspC domain-containing protein [Salsipaludibacter albus]|uniref:PspC domain-containing protein n=1 Tax=Salsipaludibacter albus TaxID=2849650 RepID=UPI001EE4415A|nr:PspC domain-containing protein [Salsipaludibacter albus]MBY5161187.1 PspC domain-containing protein [Salsipaludibacter albus]